MSVGTSLRGALAAAFDADVGFVLGNGAEVSQATFRMWFLVHGPALGLLAVVLTVLEVRRTGRSAEGRSDR